MYLLQRSRFSEALALFHRLEAVPGAREKGKTRRGIMERYARANVFPLSRYSFSTFYLYGF